MPPIEVLTKDNVIEIHNRLMIDAAESEDPISPPGIKDIGLLESAISRQESGYGGKLKYDNPIANAASLCYGICCNHALHNGNKRTALVAMLCHLDKNGFTFDAKTNQDNLYSFMLKVADHSLVQKKRQGKNHDQSDLEIVAMTDWIRKRTRKIEKGERSLSYPKLEKLLKQHDVYFENPRNNTIDVIKYTIEKQTYGWFKKTKDVQSRVQVANIPYWPNRTVGKSLIKSIRKQAGLTNKEGFDSGQFYGNETTPDDFIQKYKKTLSKLAKT